MNGVRWEVVVVEYRTGHPDYAGGRWLEAYKPDSYECEANSELLPEDVATRDMARDFLDGLLDEEPDYELDAMERSERAMQAGMAFGCDGYNDEMGY